MTPALDDIMSRTPKRSGDDASRDDPSRDDPSRDGLPVLQAAALDQAPAEQHWLIDGLWAAGGVGILGGAPKNCKSWLGLDMAVSVASATPCLGRFAVRHPRPALVYLAEDSLPLIRERLACLCAHRALPLHALPLHVITAPTLRLDSPDDQRRLRVTLETLRPALLVLDPLVRLHRLDENSAADVSALLGDLRALSRSHHLAIVVVHHMTKSRGRNLGQALRGSGDLHAWGDSNAYLVRQRDHLCLTLEHRSAPAPEPISLSLVAKPAGQTHLECSTDLPDNAPATTLSDAVRAALRDSPQPLSRAALRRRLRVNNQRLGDALTELEGLGHLRRESSGWSLASSPAIPASALAPETDTRQLSLA